MLRKYLRLIESPRLAINIMRCEAVSMALPTALQQMRMVHLNGSHNDLFCWWCSGNLENFNSQNIKSYSKLINPISLELQQLSEENSIIRYYLNINSMSTIQCFDQIYQHMYCLKWRFISSVSQTTELWTQLFKTIIYFCAILVSCFT